MGVSKFASDSEIKKAFRQKAKLYHPDVSTEENAKEHFEEVYTAYEILLDTDKRLTYDRLFADNEDDSYIEVWRQNARNWAEEFAEMSYDDFLEKKIIVHIWSTNRAVESFIAICNLVVGILGTAGIVWGVQDIREQPFAFFPLSMGVILAFGGFYLFLAFIFNTLNNSKIRKDKT